jgi:hypothetical protein
LVGPTTNLAVQQIIALRAYDFYGLFRSIFPEKMLEIFSIFSINCSTGPQPEILEAFETFVSDFPSQLPFDFPFIDITENDV